MTLAPHVPADYYRSIADVERSHWWHQGMLAISAALLGRRLTAGGRVLDAGCGTGGFLRFLLDRGRFASLAGADIASVAIELARERVPDADLRVAPLRELPFDDGAFDLIVSNDVLQHIPERDMAASMLELHRVLARGGTLFVRTNGSRRLHRERDDWRVYDRNALVTVLANGGFEVERITNANTIPSLLAAAKGRAPRAPTGERHGIPQSSGRLATAIGRLALGVEAAWFRSGRTLAYGHTLFAVAVRR